MSHNDFSQHRQQFSNNNFNNNFNNINNNDAFFNNQPFDNFNDFFDKTPNNNSATKVSNYSVSFGSDNNNNLNNFNNNNNPNNFNNTSNNNNNYDYLLKPKQRYHIGWQDPKTKTLKPKITNKLPSGIHNTPHITKTTGITNTSGIQDTQNTHGTENTTVAITTKGIIPEEDTHVKYLDQDYEGIRQKCLLGDTLWEDDLFPALMTSLFPSGNSGGWENFEWKRPGEICPKPRMFIDGHDRFDITQGELGNCWFLAATASLCSVKNNKTFERVVPRDNIDMFIGGSYAGIFKFNIWQYGRWTEVVVDDRLPTNNGRLVFVHSDKNNEFWPALLEKAYAKINGSYEALQGGNVGEAMVDFTGGIVKAYDFTKDVPDNFFKVMKQAFDRDSLLGCSIDPQIVGGSMEGKLQNGLITGHAYSITGLRSFNLGGRKVELVRVRNPWGNEEEWKGAWSDGSSEWKTLSESEKSSLQLTFDDDGEFWMTCNDLLNNFTHAEICMATPKHDPSLATMKLSWQTTCYEGSWKKGVNSGGCRNNLGTFATNPQYIIDVKGIDENSDGTVFIALLQKDRRKLKQHKQRSFISSQQQTMLTLGYYIYTLPESHSGILDINFFKYNLSTAKSPAFSNPREMVGRHNLPPGKYVIIPTTYKPNQDGDFLLRIFSETTVDMKEADEITGFVDKPGQKVKEDMPVYGDNNGTGNKGFKGMIPADSEMKRLKMQLVTPEEVEETKDIKSLFKRVSGEDLEVDAYELKSIMEEKFRTEFKFEGFSLETTRSMVAMMDTDHSGKLGYDEFKQLWKDVRYWKKVFTQYNNSSLSTLDTFELRSALNSAGFLVSNHTLKCLTMRYGDNRGLMLFNNFVHCAVKLKSMFATYETLIRAKSTTTPPILSIDEFVQTTMYS